MGWLTSNHVCELWLDVFLVLFSPWSGALSWRFHSPKLPLIFLVPLFAFMLSPMPSFMNFKSGTSPLLAELSSVSWLTDIKLLVQCSLQNALRANANRSTSPELLPAFVLIFHYPSVKTQVSVISVNESSEAPVSFQKKLLPLRPPFRRSGLCLPSLSVWSTGEGCKWAQYEQGTVRQFQAIHKYLRANKSRPQRWAHAVCSAGHGLVAAGCEGGSWREPSLLLGNSLLSPEAPALRIWCTVWSTDIWI